MNHAGLGRRPALWTAFALAGLVLSLFSGAVFGGQVFFKRDLLLTVYPQLEAVVRAVAEGSWPTWDPASSFGQPLLADPGAQVLYPPSALNLALAPWTYHAVFVIVHLWASGLGLYLLGRRLGFSAGAALASSAFWVTGGPLQATVDLPHHLAGACWMPWVFLAAESALASGRTKHVVAWGAAAAGQILAGSADVLALTAVALLGFVATRHVAWRAGGSDPNRRVLRSCVAAALVALGLTAALWMPAVDVVSRSARRALPFEIRTMWSVHPVALGDLVFPGVWRPLVPRGDPRFDREVREPFFETYYLGVAGLGLVGAALVGGPSRTKRLFLLLGAAAALVALGRHAPFYSWVVAVLPPLGILRYPVKALLLTGFSWALLAGFGLDVLRRSDPPPPWRYRLAVEGPLLLVASVSWAGHACLALPSLRPWAVGVLARLPLVLPVEDVRLHLETRLWMTGSVAALALALVALAGRKWGWAPFVGAALALLAVADLGKYHRYASLAPREMVHYRPEALDLVGDPGRARLFVYDYLSPGPSVRHVAYPVVLGRRPPGWTEEQAYALGMQAALGYASAQRWGARGGYEGDLRGLHPAPLVALTRRLRDLETTAAWTKILRMGAVTHAVSLHDLGAPGLDPPAVLPGLFLSPIRVQRVAHPLPRAYAIARTRIADDAAALARFAEPDWDPAQELVLPEGRASSPAGRFEGSARIVEERTDRVVLEAGLSEPGFVVLVDTFDPGWRAAVDGEPRPVLRANVAFRAVGVPAGRHLVSFEYRPWPVEAGAAVSAGTAILLLGLLAVRRASRRGLPSPSGAA
jgi:hypothetical protein